MEKLSDLRFIIGLFFGLAGALLLLLALTSVSGKEFGKDLNLYAGLAMMVFGGFMLWLNSRR
jgi:hypothetical protein